MTDVITQDNAETQLVNTPSSPPPSVTGLAPDYSGGYYGEQTEASGGGSTIATANNVPGPAALSASEQQNLAPSYAGGYYGDQNEASGGGFDPSAETITTGPVANEASVADTAPNPAADTTQNLNTAPNYNSPNAPSKPTTATPDTNTNKPLPNRLKDYPSYIYGLSLHLLSDSDYNHTVETQTYTPKNVLVASAGRYSPDNFPRNQFFSEDFYFEDFSMTTVIAPNDLSRNTNAIEGSFTLIEPYGFTFVERLLLAAKDINAQNYLDMPYLIQIDFFAMGDDGSILGSIEDLRKRVPCKITNLEIRVTVKGAEYKITYVPFHHSAYDMSTCSTPANFEITASTVANFFQSVEGTTADEVTALNAVRAEVQAANGSTPAPTNSATQTTGKNRFASIPTTPQPNTATAKPTPSTPPAYNKFSSYGSAINQWMQALVQYNKISVADVYRFEFPKTTLDDGTTISIGDSLFTDQLRHTPKETSMKGNQTPGDIVAMKRADLGQTVGGTVKTTTANPTPATTSATPTYTSGVVDQTYFIKAPGESDAAYAKRMRDYANTQNAAIKAATASATTTNNAIAGSYDKTYFIKAPGESDAAYAKRMQDYATQQNARLGVTTTIPAPAAPATPNVALYDPTKAIFQIQAGTTIDRLIDYIVRNSDYIQNQLIVPEDPDYASKKEALKDKPLYWFKIIPTVRLLDFDVRKRVWAREITYSVIPYKIYNLRADIGPQGVQLYPVKYYNYLYTGQNDDVLDFDIKFNALYFNQVTAYRNSLTDVNPTAASNTTDNQTQNYPNYNGGGNAPTTTTAASSQYDAVMPLVMKPVVQNSRSNATGGASTAKETASVDLEASIMTNSQADMLNVKLKIIGDPDYIKQDDVFYRPPLEGFNVASKPSTDPRLTAGNSSLVMDKGGLYVQLLFRIPSDIDETTGFMKFNTNYKQSVFSGLYIVTKVSSHFTNGQFTQELELVRLVRQQAYDYVNGQNNQTSDNRTPTAQITPGVTPPTPVPTVEVAGGGPDPSTASAADSANNQTPGQDQQITQAIGPDYSGGYYGDQTETSGGGFTPGQQDLMAVNETAPSAVITDQTEPQAIVPNFTPISIKGNQVPGQAAVTG